MERLKEISVTAAGVLASVVNYLFYHAAVILQGITLFCSTVVAVCSMIWWIKKLRKK
jgi:hypothetical protein